jgi:methionyl-tRNA formyltransferase
MSSKIKIVFMGTPDFAVPTLKALAAETSFEIVGVFTQPDRPVGRKQQLTPPAVKAAALKLRLPVFQSEKIKLEIEQLQALKPDLIVVAAYGQILSATVLDIPAYGCINIHASLLPKYRGAACLQAPILNGDRLSGVTIMKMDIGLDTGPILKQKSIKLSPIETLATLHDQLSELGAKILIPTLKKYLAGKIIPLPQDECAASYIKMLRKEDGRIDWEQPAKAIERKVRAFNPWPGTYSLLSQPALGIDKLLFKILAVRPEPIQVNSHVPGELFMYNNALAVQCGQNSLVIIKLQLEGRNIMEVDDFLRGNHTIMGTVLK